MIINHNIPALNTYRQMGINQNAAQKAMEKLSSGLRINRAGDDAAGLAISEKMRAQIRGLDQASRNAQDGISMIQTAEGALQETHAILQRMRELATQAANDTNVEVDRTEIQKEINQLSSEINRIGNTTEFNTQRLLNGDRSSSKVVGDGVTKTVITDQTFNATSGTDGVTVDNGAIAIKDSKVTIDGNYEEGAFKWDNIGDNINNNIKISKDSNGQLLVEINADDGSGGTTGNTLTVTDRLDPEFDENGEFTYNNHGVSFTITKDAFDAATASAAVTIDVVATGTGEISTDNAFTSNDAKVTFKDNAIKVDGATLTSEFADARSISVSYDPSNDKLTVKILAADGSTALSNDVISWDGSSALTYKNHGVEFELSQVVEDEEFAIELSLATADVNTPETEDSSILFQIGANQNQSMSISIEDMRSQALGVTSNGASQQWVEISRRHESLIEAGTMITGADAEALGLDGSKYYIQATFTSTKDVTDGTNADGKEFALSMETHESAAAAITVINDAIERVSAQRSQLGAYQNRLEHTIANLDNSAENLQAAESRIRDVDMAREIMEMTRANILGQASQAMLAQANQAPQAVLQLLG